MRTRRQATISELRLAIDCLPASTRRAMLAGIERNDIIVGAYTDDGGICPMLAAHRAGGRTNLISFAKAWDRFAFRGAAPVARRASGRELLILRTHLEASLLDDDGPAPDLAEAMAEHRELVSRHAPRPAVQPASREQHGGSRPARERPGDPDRSRELRTRHGWAWMRVFRRYDEYERALERVQQEQHALQSGRERQPAGLP